MKKLLIPIMLILVCDIYAQTPFFNKKLRKEMHACIIEHSGISYPKDYGFENVFITNLLTDKNVDLHKDISRVGIYGFMHFGSPMRMFLLLKNGKSYTIMHLVEKTGDRDFSELLLDLIQYFKQNPDVDKRLLPLYTKALFDVFEYNTGLDNGHNDYSDWGQLHIKDKYQYIEKDSSELEQEK